MSNVVVECCCRNVVLFLALAWFWFLPPSLGADGAFYSHVRSTGADVRTTGADGANGADGASGLRSLHEYCILFPRVGKSLWWIAWNGKVTRAIW